MKKRFLIPSSLAFLVNAASANAQIVIEQPKGFGVQANANGNQLLTGMITTGIVIFFVVGAIGVVFMVLWGAVQWIFSGGDKEGISKARGRITHALIGLIVLALSFVIINVVGTIAGFNPLGKFTIPSFTNLSK